MRAARPCAKRHPAGPDRPGAEQRGLVVPGDDGRDRPGLLVAEQRRVRQDGRCEGVTARLREHGSRCDVSAVCHGAVDGLLQPPDGSRADQRSDRAALARRPDGQPLDLAGQPVGDRSDYVGVH